MCTSGSADGESTQKEPSPLCTLEEDDWDDYYGRLPKMPQGVKDSIDAVGPSLAMPALVAVAPVIGMLATGVRLDVHGVKNALNLIAYVAGDFASGKGSIDPLIAAWTSELRAMERVYQQQEEEWRAKKRAAKNKKEQPEEPKLPIRLLTLNNTVANLAERLANTDGRHAFSFTPEADTVAQKWKSSINDFSVMLDAYDVIADYLLDCALHFFRDRIENAFNNRNYVGSSERTRTGKNDTIFARLDTDFGFEGALQQSIAVKGTNVSRNQVQQMLKNWKRQGLITQTDTGRFRKVQSDVS